MMSYTLFYTKRSPYARKVRVMAYEKGVAEKLKLVEVDLMHRPHNLLDANPLGKIPALRLGEERGTLYESPVICEFIETLSDEPVLIPAGQRIEILNMTALADGLADACVAWVMEQRRDEDQQSLDALARYNSTIVRTLARFDRDIAWFDKPLTLAHIALGTTLGYVMYRLPNLRWEGEYPRLKIWYDTFSERESMELTRPMGNY